ncbi:hypothetical protein BCR44DRAFT_1431126 [Catenaria anguillulae PL171]|uniref:Uncharacterized protein n=1 Tax=Catenaria anguillulae PL171 TaxID=765915 RepID=A0A1Y2HQW4_9FUNG|nr:hypothetical protein BCR44DRAFT_1431126 [Catenaria anguillulae PL171]
MSAPDKAHFSFDEITLRRAEIDQALLQYLNDIGHLTCILDGLLAAPPPNPHMPTNANAMYEPDAFIRKHFHAIHIDKPDLPARHKLDHLLYMHAHHRAVLASMASQLARGAADLAPMSTPTSPNPGAIMVDFGFAPYGGGSSAAAAIPFPWPRALLYRPVKPDAHTVVRVSPYLRVYLQVGGSAGRRREFSVRRERGGGAAAAKEPSERTGSTATVVSDDAVVTAATAYARRARARGAATRAKDKRHAIDTILRRAQANYYGYSSASVKDDEGRIVEVPGSSDEGEEEDDNYDNNNNQNMDTHGEGAIGDEIAAKSSPEKEAQGSQAQACGGGCGWRCRHDWRCCCAIKPIGRRPSTCTTPGTKARRQPDTSIRSMLDPLLLAMDMPLFDFVQWVEFSDFVRDIHAHVRRSLQLARIVLPDASGVRMHVPQESEVSSSSLAAGGGARGGRTGAGGEAPTADPAADAESWSGLEIQVFLSPRVRAPRFSSSSSHLLLDRTSLPVFILGLSPPCKLFVRVHDAIRFRNLTPTSRQIQDLVNHHVERELAQQVHARAKQWGMAGNTKDTLRVKVSVNWSTQFEGGPSVKLSVYAAGEGAVAAAGGLDAAAAQGGAVAKTIEVHRFGPGWVERALVELGVI